jgi:hypothetical protein
MGLFFKEKPKDRVVIQELTELFEHIKRLELKINSLEIEMRFLQEKIKNRIFNKPKEEEKDETNKKPAVFLNPYGNPI